MANLTIIGVGELGQALGSIFKQHRVSYWDNDEVKLKAVVSGEPLDLPEVMAGAEIVFLCVPSWKLREALAFVQPYWSGEAIATIWSKGLDEPTQKLPHEIAQKLLPPAVKLVLAGGAMIAEEIGSDRHGACLLAGDSGPVVGTLFAETKISIRISDDLDGLAWSGVLKNIYAIGLGLASGLDFSLNERAILFGLAQAEAGKLVKVLGGRKETWLAPEIAADFLTTSFNNHSLNHQVGFNLGRSGTIEKSSEGLMSLPPLLTRLGSAIDKYPLLARLSPILLQAAEPASWREVF